MWAPFGRWVSLPSLAEQCLEFIACRAAPRGHPRGIAVFVAMELVNSIAISFVAHWSHSMDRR